MVYVPNAVCLSESQIRILEKYVKGGGALIATCMTSLADENGRLRDNYGFASLFGIDYCKESDFDAGYVSITPDSALFHESIDYPAVLRSDPLYFSTSDGTEVLASLMNPVGMKTPEQFYSHNVIPPDPDLEPQNPLIVHRKSGKGSSVYIGANLEKDYAKYGYSTHREIVRKIIEHIIDTHWK